MRLLAPLHLHAPPVSLPSVFPPSPDPTRLPSRPHAFPTHPPPQLPSPAPSPPVSLPSIFPPQPLVHTSMAPSESAPHGLPTDPQFGPRVALGAWQFRLSSGPLLDLSYTWNLSDLCRSSRVGHALTVWRIPCAHLGHPTPSYQPRCTAPLRLPTHVREAWTSITPTHASFYLCTDPERPTMMLVMRPCARRNLACRRHGAHFGHPRPYLSPATPLHSPPNVPPRSWTSTSALPLPEQPALMLVVRPCAQRNHVCRVHSAHFGHPRPYLSPATPLHCLPTCLHEAWSSSTPTHASFYFCTAPGQPAMMLVMLAGSRLAALHFPSPAPVLAPVSLPSICSLPNPVPTRAPPVSLPSLPLPSFPSLPSPPSSFPSLFPSQPRPPPPPSSVPDNVSFSSLSPGTSD